MHDKKVLLIIAHQGFRPEEYWDTKRVLEEAGVWVITASNLAGKAEAAYGGESVEADLTVKEVRSKDYAGIFLVGGPGALENLDNEDTRRMMREAAALGRAHGAICISPRILAKAGLLSDKKATGWDNDNQLTSILQSANARYIREAVVADGKLVTANGPAAAKEFGRKILEVL